MCVAYLAAEARAAALDPAFGTGGMVLPDFGASSAFNALALQPDGRIVAGGSRGTDLLVARYLANGASDSSWAGGYATVYVPIPGVFGANTVASALAIQPSGRVVAAGRTWALMGLTSPALEYSVLAGFTSSGGLDSGFASGGTAKGLSDYEGGFTQVALQPDGKILAAGRHYQLNGRQSTDSNYSVARYQANGAPDPGFAGGFIKTPGESFALQPDANILVARWAGRNFFTERYSSTGTAVSNSSMPLAVDNDAQLDMLLQPDGRLLVAGRAGFPGLGLLARFTAAGSHDTGFGNGGVFTSNPPIGRLALQADGRIVGLTGRFELFRIEANGSPDTSFGRNGRFAIAVPPGSTASAVVVQPDGKILVAGWSGGTSFDAGSNGVPILARVDPALPTPPLSFAPTSLAFAGQSWGTTSAAQQVVFTNTGSSSLSVSAVTASAEFNAATFGVAHDCATVAPGSSCSIQVTFTPMRGYSGIQGALSINVQGEAVYVPLSGVGEGTLTSHYYRSILRREPESSGREFWNGEAARVASLGADPIETWFAMAMSFFTSPEYLAFARDNAGFVTDLYTTFFNRAPDTGGRDYWAGQLVAGLPREAALAGFMFSTEFANFVNTHYGTTPMRAEVRMAFDFYRGLLARLPDSNGLNYWVGRFRQAQCVGGDTVRIVADQISAEFLQGAEYAGRNRTNSQYVGDLYNAFLRRGGDLGGVQFWIDRLTTGASTREDLRRAFVASPEFSARVTAVANQGCLPQ